MEISPFPFAFSILLLNSITFCLGNTFSNSTTDKDALVSFKTFITSDPHTILTDNWSKNTSVCNWIGVSCDVKNQRVTALNLSGYDLVGTIAPHLGNLTFLRYLDISYNAFTGSIPEEIGNLKALERLSIGDCALIGTIPSSLFNISTLKFMNLTSNGLYGNIPTSHNLLKLEELYLSWNNLDGRVPSYMFDNMHNIKRLSLANNQLVGDIPPNIWNCTYLESLDLSSNYMSANIRFQVGGLSMLRELSLGKNKFGGIIPQEIGNLSQLELLSISELFLMGKIPYSIFNISSLKFIDLSDNMISGELPQEIGTLPSLEVFDVSWNSLYGSIPHSIFNTSTLKNLDLSGNNFSGTLPSDLGPSLFSLEGLLLRSNTLHGPIPTSITNASRLIILDMSNNSFSGSIPNLGNLRLLKRLTIDRNNLSSGAQALNQELTFLSSLTNCRYLKGVDVSDNPLNGILSVSIGNLSSSLEYLRASYNNIMGVIPSEIGNLTSLFDLFMEGNQLRGPILPTIWKFTQLQRLYLSGNQLVGSISNQICQVNNLGALSLSRNKLEGPIPECLGEVKSLREIYLDSNQLNSNVPPNVWTLTDLIQLNLSSNYLSGQLPDQFGMSFRVLRTLDLSSNIFSGDIPATIGGCQSLEFLNLSSNHFNGSIPQSLGNVISLTILDLSYNRLSGSIPNSLQHLHFLTDFNASHNFAHSPSPISLGVPPCSNDNPKSRNLLIVVLMIIVVINIVIIMIVFIRKRNESVFSIDTSPIFEWRRISYVELDQGTNSFSESNLLGRGSSGSVYEATLYDGLKVAVKVFNLQIQGVLESFDTETGIIRTIRHRNLLQVIGCCSIANFKAWILPYMPNGSLEKCLYSGMHCLDLLQRLKIAVDVAVALEYLHHGYTFPIVHCNIKPSNVLLDEDMTVHLADFGIAKLFGGGEAFIHKQTSATMGYAAPELGPEWKVSTSGDVYSFGIMLLEMFTGKKPTDDMFGGEVSLKEWVSDALQENALNDIVASALLSREDQHFSTKEQSLSSIFELAMKCVAIPAEERINMIEAAATLRKINETTISAIDSHHPQYAFSVSIHNNGV